MNASDVGNHFVDENEEIWKMISFCEHPTATLEKVGDKSIHVGGAVGCLLLSKFKKLPSYKEIK